MADTHPDSKFWLFPINCYANQSVRFILSRQLRMQKREVSNILRELRSQINNKSTRLNINKQNLWDSALKGFQKRNFIPSNTIEVKYIDCKNKTEMDICHSSKEDFFRLLMLHLQNSPLFEGTSSKNLSFDSQGKSKLYIFKEVGKQLSFILFFSLSLQGVGVVHVGLSHFGHTASLRGWVR